MSSRRNRRMSMGGGAFREDPPRPRSHSSRRMSMALPSRATPLREHHTIRKLQQSKQNRSYDRADENDYLNIPSSNRRQTVAPGVSMFQHSTATAPTPKDKSAETALDIWRKKKNEKLRRQHQLETSNCSLEEECSGYAAPLREPSPATNHRFPDPLSIAREKTISFSSSLPPINDYFLNNEGNEGGISHDSQQTAVEKARISILQQRVQELEAEKAQMQLHYAPVETRYRQAEEAWNKEELRLLQLVDAMKGASQTANEQFRDMKAENDAKGEEIRQLRNQLRKETRSTPNKKYSESDGELEQELNELQQKYQVAQENLNKCKLSRISVEKQLHGTQMELESIAKAFEQLQEAYGEVSQKTSNDEETQIQLDALSTEHNLTTAQLNAALSDIAAAKASFGIQMNKTKEEHEAEVNTLKFDLSVMTNRWEKEGVKKSVAGDGAEDFAVLKAHIEERDRKIAEFEKERLEWETHRRQMHNRIQELSGNIRVFVRTRPFLPNDGPARASSIDVSMDGESMTILDGRTGSPFDFKFDKVFAPSAGQDNIFEEVADFVQSALDGYNVCLFSYGQTGSGKTHTMQGSGNGAMRGIIPRAVEQILKQVKKMQSHGWKFSLDASFLEIYNEELRDLLVEMAGGSVKNPPKLGIKRTRAGKSYVENLAEISIETTDTRNGMEQLDRLMKSAARSRSVASTKMNAQSSRSHSVFMLHLHGVDEQSGVEVRGALNLCDLAGSERLDRSGAGSDTARLRETQAINKSLSCLGDVFNALAQKANHIPFRNSKLTYLLQDCLSGDGKALMFVNLSPTCASSNESLCSLRFAQRVNKVELGKAKKQVTYNKTR